MFFRKWSSKKDLREAYRAAELIQAAETVREADMLTGYAIGIIDEKQRRGRMTRQTAEAIAEMVDALGEEIRRDLIEERRAAESEREEREQEKIAQFPAAVIVE